MNTRGSGCTEVDAGRRQISQDAEQVSLVVHATNPWEHFKRDMLLFELLKMVLAAV